MLKDLMGGDARRAETKEEHKGVGGGTPGGDAAAHPLKFHIFVAIVGGGVCFFSTFAGSVAHTGPEDPRQGVPEGARRPTTTVPTRGSKTND